MFEWLNKQGVKAQAGFVLQRVHRFCYHYIEGQHVLKVDVESGAKGEDIFFFSNARWESPHESEQIVGEKRDEIERRVVAALTFMGIRHRILRR